MSQTDKFEASKSQNPAGKTVRAQTMKECSDENELSNALKIDLDSLWEKMVHLDQHYSEKFSVCAQPDYRFGYLRPLMKLLEISCHGIPWFIGTAMLLTVVHRPEDVQFLMNLFLGLVLDIVIVGLSKLIIRRARPAHNQMDMFATVSVDNFSFPSGHATRAAMLLMIFEDKVLPGLSVVWCYLMFFWALSVCSSRVILGRHHILDVVCGIAIGVVQYNLLMYLWMPSSLCMGIFEPFLGHFHL